MKKWFKTSVLFLTILASFLAPFQVQLANNTERKVVFSHSLINAQEKEGITPQTPTNPKISVGYMECETGWIGVGDIACQMVNLLQMIVVVGGNALVYLASEFMDYFLQHSIASSSYKDAGFILEGWEILRDLTNIVFIFALLIIAFKLVLGIGTTNLKKQLMSVIIVALTINFSLFISFAIIDASNVLANVLYNKISTKSVSYQIDTSGDNEIEDASSKTSVSLGIASKIQPQKILLHADKSNKNKGQRLLMIIMIGIINYTIIITFLSVALLFLGRTIALWISSVLAPLAFASITIPQLSKVKYIGFDKWLKSLLETAFMAPVFIFFLYLSLQFMNINIFGGGASLSDDFLTLLLKTVIPMAATVIIIRTSKTVATSMSGDFAGQITAMVGKIAGGALAAGALVATGGASVALGAAGKGASLLGRTGVFL